MKVQSYAPVLNFAPPIFPICTRVNIYKPKFVYTYSTKKLYKRGVQTKCQTIHALTRASPSQLICTWLPLLAHQYYYKCFPVLMDQFKRYHKIIRAAFGSLTLHNAKSIYGHSSVYLYMASGHSPQFFELYCLQQLSCRCTSCG